MKFKQVLSILFIIFLSTEALAYDSVSRKIKLAEQFLDCSNKSNKFEDVIHFIKANPHWSRIDKLSEKAENYINSSTKPRVILEWFRSHEPKTPNGYKFYALANGKDPNIIKQGWIYGNFGKNEESDYLKKFGKYLTEQDHVKKIDEFLWKGDTQTIQRLLYLVSSGYKKAFEAGMLLSKSNSKGENVFNKLPPKYYTSGILYKYLEYKKKQSPTHKSIALFEKVPVDPKHGNDWSKLHLYYAREFIDRKAFKEAYKVITQHFANGEEESREANWLAGWLALRFLHKPTVAIVHFEKFSQDAKKSISIARGAYWLARSYVAIKNKEKAFAYYNKAAQYQYTWYGQLALLELKQDKLKLPAEPQVSNSQTKNSKARELMEAAYLLAKEGKMEHVKCYIKAAISNNADPHDVIKILKEIKQNTNIPYYAVDVAKVASQHNVFLKSYAFPTPYLIPKPDIIEPALSYSVIRQESVFNPKAVSCAKAYGLMQLIAPTACKVAKSINTGCNISRLTSDTAYNIKLGSHYLKQLLSEHDGSYILSIASYNAGPHKVSKWIERFGDPRDIKDYKQAIDWIELIPYSETRNYVQRVLENLQIYRVILKPNSKLQIQRDLLR